MNKIESLKEILDLIKKHKVTAYEISKNTPLTAFAVQKIISGNTKNPNENTINALLFYLRNIENKNYQFENSTHILSDSSEQKPLITQLNDSLKEQIELLKYIQYLKGLLIENNIEFIDKKL